MTKTIYDTFKDFPSFWTQLKNKFSRDYRPKNLINNLFFSNRIYDYYKHDTYYGTSDEALNRIFTQITFDCAEFSKKEALHAKIYEKVEKWFEITTRTEERKQSESTQTIKPPKTITTQNEPLLSLTDLSAGNFGGHNRADLLKTTQKHTGADTTNTIIKQGLKVVDKEGKPKTVPNWVEVETQNPAGLARILACFSSLEIDLSQYLARYRKFFYSSYGLEGEIIPIEGGRRHIFKSWEEIEEEEKAEEGAKPIPTEEPELSYNEWKKKFKEEHPDQVPNYQLYTVYRLEKRKAELAKELKKTSGVFNGHNSTGFNLPSKSFSKPRQNYKKLLHDLSAIKKVSREDLKAFLLENHTAFSVLSLSAKHIPSTNKLTVNLTKNSARSFYVNKPQKNSVCSCLLTNQIKTNPAGNYAYCGMNCSLKKWLSPPDDCLTDPQNCVYFQFFNSKEKKLYTRFLDKVEANFEGQAVNTPLLFITLTFNTSQTDYYSWTTNWDKTDRCWERLGSKQEWLKPWAQNFDPEAEPLKVQLPKLEADASQYSIALYYLQLFFEKNSSALEAGQLKMSSGGRTAKKESQ